MVPNTIQHLESPTLNLLLVMVLIWTTGVLFRNIKQPPLLGELLAGIIFGPALLGILKYDATLEVLSELGVFFLMFYAGIETNPFDLKRMGRLSTLVGLGGFFIPFIMGYAVSIFFFELSVIQSLFIGLGLSITAIAVNARVLNDFSLQRFRVTPVIMGAAIIDDILSLALLSIIIGLVVNNYIFDWQTLILVLLKVFLFFGVSIFLGMKLYPKVSKYFTFKEAKGFTFSLIVALIFGYLAELAGLHIILGAYMAGLFVREEIVNRALLYKINQRFVSITYGFLGPIFFVCLSFHMTFDIFRTDLLLIIVLLIAAVVGKILGAGFGAYLGKMNIKESTVVAFAMNGRGAVELIIASVGLKLGIIDDRLFSILVVIAFITTLLPPIMLNAFMKRIDEDALQIIE